MQFLKLFFKVDHTKIYCGIFAFSGIRDLTDAQAKSALIKVKILGFYNESRGGQGAGIFINDKIIKCGDKHKTFPALMENNIFEDSTTNHIIIGHCRKSSRGAISTENTHPFIINEDLVGVHNGTVENIWELSRKYNVDTKQIFNDSRALFMIIEDDGINVLDEYRGTAALIWTRLSTPNSINVFRGESKKWSTSALEDEKPLYYLSTEEGVYFSSMEESLWAIRDEEDQIPEPLPCNIVHKVENGRFVGTGRRVNREEANVSAHYNSYNSNLPILPPKPPAGNAGNASIGGSTPVPFRSSGVKPQPTIWRETIPAKVLKAGASFKGVYFHKGRFYSSPKVLCHGELFLLKKGQFADDTTVDRATPYYFFRGVMLNGNKENYQKLLKDVDEGRFIISPTANFAMSISIYSKHPVTNLNADSAELVHEYRFKWYKNGTPFNDSFTPTFGSRNYNIKGGYLESISSSDKDDYKTLYDSFEEASKKEIIKPTEDSDIYFDSIPNDLTTCLRGMPEAHMVALEMIAEENLKQIMMVDPDPNEITEEVTTTIQDAINRKVTIREAFGDRDGSLDNYVITTDSYRRVRIDPPAGITRQMQIEDDSTAIMRARNSAEDMDSVLHASYEEEEKKVEELDRANDIVDEMTSLLENLTERTVELSQNESAFGKMASSILTRKLDALKNDLAAASDTFSTKEMTEKINNSITL